MEAIVLGVRASTAATSGGRREWSMCDMLGVEVDPLSGYSVVSLSALVARDGAYEAIAIVFGKA